MDVHILSRVYGEEVEGYPDGFLRLEVKHIIPRDLAAKLAATARLRNLLVHRYYFLINYLPYLSAKQGSKDFVDFIRYVNDFLETSRDGRG